MVGLKEIFSKNKILLPVIAVVILLLAVGLTGSLVAKEGKAISNKKGELSHLRKDLELLDKILSEQKTSEGKMESVRKTLPVSYQDVAFAVSQIEAAATASGQKLEAKIEEKALPEPDDLLSLKIALITEGSYSNFSKMLNTMANLPYHTRVDTLKIQPAGSGISALTNLRLYLRKE